MQRFWILPLVRLVQYTTANLRKCAGRKYLTDSIHSNVGLKPKRILLDLTRCEYVNHLIWQCLLDMCHQWWPISRNKCWFAEHLETRLVWLWSPLTSVLWEALLATVTSQRDCVMHRIAINTGHCTSIAIRCCELNCLDSLSLSRIHFSGSNPCSIIVLCSRLDHD